MHVEILMAKRFILTKRFVLVERELKVLARRQRVSVNTAFTLSFNS